MLVVTENLHHIVDFNGAINLDDNVVVFAINATGTIVAGIPYNGCKSLSPSRSASGEEQQCPQQKPEGFLLVS